jgi:hypothetical protein
VGHTDDAPVLADLIDALYAERSAADARADAFARLLADLELLHEPDAGGDCPTCVVEAPCLTLRLVRHEVTIDDAVASVRDNRVIDLDAGRPTPTVPSLKELLAVAPHGVDKFFEALLGLPSTDHPKAS